MFAGFAMEGAVIIAATAAPVAGTGIMEKKMTFRFKPRLQKGRDNGAWDHLPAEHFQQNRTQTGGRFREWAARPGRFRLAGPRWLVIRDIVLAGNASGS